MQRRVRQRNQHEGLAAGNAYCSYLAADLEGDGEHCRQPRVMHIPLFLTIPRLSFTS